MWYDIPVFNTCSAVVFVVQGWYIYIVIRFDFIFMFFWILFLSHLGKFDIVQSPLSESLGTLVQLLIADETANTASTITADDNDGIYFCIHSIFTVFCKNSWYMWPTLIAYLNLYLFVLIRACLFFDTWSDSSSGPSLLDVSSSPCLAHFVSEAWLDRLCALGLADVCSHVEHSNINTCYLVHQRPDCIVLFTILLIVLCVLCIRLQNPVGMRYLITRCLDALFTNLHPSIFQYLSVSSHLALRQVRRLFLLLNTLVSLWNSNICEIICVGL